MRKIKLKPFWFIQYEHVPIIGSIFMTKIAAETEDEARILFSKKRPHATILKITQRKPYVILHQTE